MVYYLLYLRGPSAKLSKFFIIDPSILKFSMLIQNAIPQLFCSHEVLKCSNIFLRKTINLSPPRVFETRELWCRLFESAYPHLQTPVPQF